MVGQLTGVDLGVAQDSLEGQFLLSHGWGCEILCLSKTEVGEGAEKGVEGGVMKARAACRAPTDGGEKGVRRGERSETSRSCMSSLAQTELHRQ